MRQEPLRPVPLGPIPSRIRKQDPPEDEDAALCEEVLKRLKAEPGDWFLVAEDDAFTLFPWWAALRTQDGVETRIKRKLRSPLFGPRDVYARYVGHSETRGTQSWDDEARNHGA